MVVLKRLTLYESISDFNGYLQSSQYLLIAFGVITGIYTLLSNMNSSNFEGLYLFLARGVLFLMMLCLLFTLIIWTFLKIKHNRSKLKSVNLFVFFSLVFLISLTLYLVAYLYAIIPTIFYWGFYFMVWTLASIIMLDAIYYIRFKLIKSNSPMFFRILVSVMSILVVVLIILFIYGGAVDVVSWFVKASGIFIIFALFIIVDSIVAVFNKGWGIGLLKEFSIDLEKNNSFVIKSRNSLIKAHHFLFKTK